ncbi:MAG: VOC family protein [Caulobacteraceae bacterium]|nr:VOC family protein [Caulobacteraceae bacterium]
MALRGLDHITVRCADIARSRSFYAEALGLRDGERPGVSIPGAWLYLGDRPVVHLFAAVEDAGEAAGAGFDHFAFEADDLPNVRARLERLGVAFRESDIPDMRLHQLFLRDPDGVKIEINFRG